MNPAMTQNEKQLFKKYLNNATDYFEFGIGGSTVWANNTQNIKKIVCVESDAAWIEKVVSLVCNKKTTIHHINYATGALGAPINGLKHLKITEQEQKLWERYSCTINQTNQLYDLILVDGRFRVACALAAYSNLCNKGFLIVHDYANRAHYHIIENFYKKIEEVENLAIFQKKEVYDSELFLNTYNNYKLIFD